ncbi:MAG: YceD family protein, partial [Pseudomonadota bacterium]
AGDGTLHVDLAVEVGDADQILVSGTVNGTLALQCQRCLEPADVPVSIDVKLAVAASESTPAPAGYELVTGDARTLLLRDLLEDDILLALPPVPMHTDPADCGDLAALMNDYRATDTADEDPALEGSEAEGEEKRHPFAILKKLQSD